jgi:mRNA interferase HigB
VARQLKKRFALLAGQRGTPTYTALTTSHIVKYSMKVHIVTRRHLSEAVQRYRDAASEIKAWVSIVERVRWHSFVDVRRIFKDADSVDGYVIFNIRQKRYRLITVIHYSKSTDERQTEGHVYIRSFLTPKEYDNRNNWDRRFGKQ